MYSSPCDFFQDVSENCWRFSIDPRQILPICVFSSNLVSLHPAKAAKPTFTRKTAYTWRTVTTHDPKISVNGWGPTQKEISPPGKLSKKCVPGDYQPLTCLSPNLGGHLSNLSKRSQKRKKHPKKVTFSQNCQVYR